MPVYEFECKKCHYRFERLQRYSDPPPESCPECGGAIQQLLSAPAIQFKGSGWYVTDYAKRNSGPAPSHNGNGNGSSSSTANNNDASTTATKSDSKPAASSDKK